MVTRVDPFLGGLGIDATGKFEVASNATVTVGDGTSTGNVVIGGELIASTVSATTYIGLSSNAITSSDTAVVVIDPNATIVTDGIERVRVNSSGNVGIGTVAPAEKLSIETGASEYALQWSGPGDDWVLGSSAGRAYIKDKTSAVEAISILNAGNVGIGTSSPDGKLNVQRTAASAGWIINGQTVGVANDSGLYMDASNNIELAVRDGSGTLTGAVRSSGFTFFNGGDVGIGTTAPRAPLHVQPAGAASDDFNVLVSQFRPNIVLEDLSAASTDFQFFVDASGFQIRSGDASTDTKLASELVRITSTGVVGIGVSAVDTTLGTKLHVAGTIRTDTGAAGANPAIVFDHDNFADADANYIMLDRTSEAMRFNVNAAERMRIDSAGLVTSSTLELSGGITYDPSGGGTGTETATDVGLALSPGTRIVGYHDGYIRTLLEWNPSSDIIIGQGGTTLIAGIDLIPGSSGDVKVNGNRILTVADEGSGNGLDADTLDGQQGSYYLNTSTSFGGDVSGTYNAIVIANDSHTHAFNNLTGKTSGTGEYSTDHFITAGRGNGGVSLTHNDGHGNANITWNHKAGTPEQNGNAARIHVNTDASTNAAMVFQVKSGVSNGVAITLTQTLSLSETTATFSGDVNVSTGKLQEGGNALIPPGSIIMYGAASAPGGWYLCEGGAISRSTYSALFGVIGTTYGVGNGSTTFNVPDFRDRAPYGASTFVLGTKTAGEVNASGQNSTGTGTSGSSGATTVANTTGAGGAHTPGVTTSTTNSTTDKDVTNAITVVTGVSAVAAHTHTIPSLTVNGHTHSVPSLTVTHPGVAVKFIIKT